jgi:hypothetical protein
MSNGVIWTFDEQTLYSNERAEDLQKAIENAGVVRESEAGLVYSFCLILIHTRGVKIDAAKAQSESLKRLPDFLATWENLTAADLWDYRRKSISHPLWAQWANDFTRHQKGSLMADPAELPEFALTTEQRDDPFLARSGESSPAI